MGQVFNKKKEDPSPTPVGQLFEDDIKIIIDNVYGTNGFKVENENDLYYAICKIIEGLREKAGAMRYILPPKEDVEKEFNEVKIKSGDKINKDDCIEIIKKFITVDSFYVGQRTRDAFLFLFGFPICAVLSKRFIPSMRSISDDIVIPVVTSASVVVLAKTNRW